MSMILRGLDGWGLVGRVVGKRGMREKKGR